MVCPNLGLQGIYLDDTEFMASPLADPADKGGSTGNKWMALPLPHKLRTPQWRIEQGILSSFVRISKNVNIPLQVQPCPPVARHPPQRRWGRVCAVPDGNSCADVTHDAIHDSPMTHP